MAPPNRRPAARRRATRGLPLALALLAAACAAPRPGPSPEAAAPPAAEPPVAYAAASRARADRLEERLDTILEVTLPQIREVQDDLAADVAALPAPEVYGTQLAELRGYDDTAREAFGETVRARCDQARQTLEALLQRALDAAAERAHAMAGERSPLDAGVTGDPLLDRQLVAFEETLRGALAFSDLEASREADAQRTLDLVQAFNSFTEPGADEQLGGRLMLFVGGDELAGLPRSHLVLRAAEGVDPHQRSFFQVFRHRILRGDAIVQDLGWRPMPAPPGSPGPGRPLQRVDGQLLFGRNVSPVLDTSDPAFEKLKDMRVTVDVQSAVLDERGAILGGIDWRIEFRISTKGEISWTLAGGRPLFDADCDELAPLLVRARQRAAGS